MNFIGNQIAAILGTARNAIVTVIVVGAIAATGIFVVDTTTELELLTEIRDLIERAIGIAEEELP